MANPDFPILPSTKVGALLDSYPELEELLISTAPPFRKLKNPLLRRGVAKVASLRQAAAVGGIPVDNLVNLLRAAVGQQALDSTGMEEANSYFSNRPEWFDRLNIVLTIDERTAEPDRMPIAIVLQEAVRLEPAKIIELVTTFIPAPGIDILRGKGFIVWVTQEEPPLVHTYISRAASK